MALAVAAAALFGLGGVAYAQNASCQQLNAQLQSLERNPSFANSGQASQDYQALAANERNAESAYFREGCQTAQQQGLPQSPQCRAFAHQVLQLRAQMQQTQTGLNNAGAIAQQRELVLQQIARFNCDQQGQSSVQFSGSNPPPRRNFLQQLFGGFQGQDQGGYGDNGAYTGPDQVEDPYADQQQQDTVRTVCVRLSDGYYWPVSYSTTRDYIPQDQQTCLSECPDQQVDLYYYANPGQEPEQMVNSEGQAYTSLPAAFAYRKQFDSSQTCKPQVVTGAITMDDLGDGRNRAVVTYGDEEFPLPERDPRATEQATAAPVTAEIDIPLPRPRPVIDANGTVTPPTAEPVVSQKSRTVKVGDKLVRIVGPDTPYAPATTSDSAGAGTSG